MRIFFLYSSVTRVGHLLLGSYRRERNYQASPISPPVLAVCVVQGVSLLTSLASGFKGFLNVDHWLSTMGDFLPERTVGSLEPCWLS